MKKWIICSECGYSKEVYSEQEIYYNENCPLCEGKMILDLSTGEKTELKPIGDNYPDFIFNKEEQEQELKRLEDNLDKIYGNEDKLEEEIANTINVIGNNATWKVIEEIVDPKLRAKYRRLFFGVGGQIPRE